MGDLADDCLAVCGKNRGQTKLSLIAVLQFSKIPARIVDSSVCPRFL